MSQDFNNNPANYLEIAAPLIEPARLPISISAWFYTPTAAPLADMVIFSSGDLVSTDRYRLLIEGSTPADRGKLRWAVTDLGTTAKAQSSGTIISKWNHAGAIEISTNNRKVYLNGSDIGTDNTLKTPSGLDVSRIGRGCFVADQWNGFIAHLAIWNQTLSDREMLSLSNGMSPLNIRRNALWFYAPLNEKDPSDSIKDIASGYIFTKYGTVNFAQEPNTLLGYQTITP